MKQSLVALTLLCSSGLFAQTGIPFPELKIYSGSTHAHSIFTMSHGEDLQKGGGDEKGMLVDSNYLNRPGNVQLKPDWEKSQGQPDLHFKLAKENKYDFYTVTDHSQEECFFPSPRFNTAWIIQHKQAQQATDKNFTALIGVEHSENNGPGGTGHYNVINAAAYLNALAPGIDIPYFYNWLKTAKPYGDGPVVVSFNHPGGKKNFDDFNFRDDSLTDIITLLEVINSNKNLHYEGFIKALDKGWKISPVCGNDNHGITAINKQMSRTFVLAPSNTQKDILEAMHERRTYASLENNIQCRYTVNGSIMGSTLNKPAVLKFEIYISDPDKTNADDKITKIDIVKDGGVVVETYNVPNPSHEIKWSPIIKDAAAKYFFVRVWNAGGGDVMYKGRSLASPEKPVAWLAPVWTGR